MVIESPPGISTGMIVWDLKQGLQQLITLDLLNYHKSLHLFIHRSSVQTLNTLTQFQRNIDVSLSYFSLSLDLEGKFYFPCLKAFSGIRQINESFYLFDFSMHLQHYDQLGDTTLDGY